MKVMEVLLILYLLFIRFQLQLLIIYMVLWVHHLLLDGYKLVETRVPKVGKVYSVSMLTSHQCMHLS